MNDKFIYDSYLVCFSLFDSFEPLQDLKHTQYID